MRILMLSQFYPPIIGGEERHVRNLSAHLAARGHDVAVATLWHAGTAEFEQEGSVRIYRIRGTMQRLEFLFSHRGHKHAPPFPDPELVVALKRIVARERPHIVHAHNWLVHSFLPLKLWSGARLVLTVHDHSLVCPKKKLIYADAPCSGPALHKCLPCVRQHFGAAKGWMVMGMNQLMNLAEGALIDAFVPVSSATARDNRLPQRALPVTVIPNFVPDQIGRAAAEPHPKLAELPAGEFMLFVGAFGRYKGVDVLVRAYRQLRAALPLVIIGYVTNEYPVRTSEFPPNVHVLTDWPHEAVMQAWQRCAFGIVPSVWSDPCPTVAMEAMAMGKALVAARIGGLTDLVSDGETGLLVTPDDADALAAAMEQLTRDPALRARMGAAAQRKVSEFQASHVVQKLEQLYTRLLQREAAPVHEPVIS